MKKIGIIGAGRLGVCLALNLERVGYSVLAIDNSKERVEAINSRQIRVEEPLVQQYLEQSTNLVASTNPADLLNEGVDFIFICVPTPSLPDGKYDHRFILDCVEALFALDKPQNQIDLIINSTTMPGFCEELHEKVIQGNYAVSYNPEFIAQGTIIRDQQYPDQVLIGEANQTSGDRIASVYAKMCPGNPTIQRMSRTSAEITKLAVNCFLTTKIAFANSIGDLALKMGADQTKVLESIGMDKRVGTAYLKYGFGFGGPCLPRDNRALAKTGEAFGIDLRISKATNQANIDHLEFQFEQYLTMEEPIVFDQVTYKEDTDIIEESQQLALAVKLMKAGKNVLLRGSVGVIKQVEKIYATSFIYEIQDDE